MSSSSTTQTRTEEILSQVEEQFGFRPNLIKQMVESPAVANVYLSGQQAMTEASLSQPEQQAVQLTVATLNQCHYCGAAHETLSKATGVSEDDVEAIKSGELPGDERLRTVVEATRRLLDKRGWLEQSELDEFERAGVDRAQVYEIIALIGLKTISNYINHIAGTEIDEQFK